ncbi:hypothetical protein FB451DRAFT_1402492 [Mycena latifolia]|nr:hypothetical protein FB451DRAFT_1402492 [Mycena latifolia]
MKESTSILLATHEETESMMSDDLTSLLKVDSLSNSGIRWPESARAHPLFISAANLMQALLHLQEVHCSRNNLALPKYGFAAYMALKLAGAAEARMLPFSTFRAVG